MKKNFSWPLLSLFLLSVFLFAAGVQASPRQEQLPLVIHLSQNGIGRGHAAAYAPDGTSLAVGSSLGLHLYDASTLELSYFIQTESWIRSLAFSRDGQILATGSYDTLIRLWRVSDGTLLHELSGHTAWVRAVAFSPDGSLLATASDDNTVRLWRADDWSTRRVIQEGTDGVRTLAFSPDGSLLATAGFDRIIRLWRVEDGTLLSELSGHGDWVRALAFSPDGLWLASGGFDATVRLWSVQSGELLITRREHSSSVLDLAFSPDGALLASASVDTTVRLWSMPSLEPYGLLQGHEDFVYAVAFSPQGTTLASTSVDETLRVWAVPQVISDEALQIVSSPKNCTSCHHPRGQIGPPRVLEPGCEVCHDQGTLVRNWCPAFFRSTSDTTLAVTLRPTIGSGVFSQNETSAVIIYTPGNGEVMYGRSGITYPLTVRGKVFHTGDLDNVHLTLEVISEGVVVDSAKNRPSPDGTFSFSLQGNPDGLNPVVPMRGVDDPCLNCHVDLYDAALPYQGSATLRVSMSVGNELQAWDERLIFLEHGDTGTIPLNVSLQDGTFLSDIPVQAETLLYEWRSRAFNSLTDGDGKASLLVEVLSHVPVTYHLSVPPVVVDGVLYESLNPVELSLPADTTTVPEVTLTVRASLGSIAGHVEGIQAPLEVWIIQFPSGFTRTVSISAQGDFFVEDLPVGKYLLAIDPGELAALGLSFSPQQVDLAAEIAAQVQFQLLALQGVSVSGKVTAQDGSWLPFAWAAAAGRVAALDPALGTYTLADLPGEGSELVVIAPGFYSQAGSQQEPLDFTLVPRPEMESIPWGAGSIFLPPETVASMEGLVLDFSRGWLWGQGSAQQPLVLVVDDVRIEIPSGRFALERLPGQAAWLYLLEGTARVQPAAGDALDMRAGQMLRILGADALQAVDYNPAVVSTLQPLDGSPLNALWQPTLWQRIGSVMDKIGVESAKVVTFVTYLIIIISLLFFPLSGVYWWLKRKNENQKTGDVEKHGRG